MDTPRPLSATEAFAFIITYLRKAVATRAYAQTEWMRCLELVWRRLLRLEGRFQVLVAQIRAGTLPPSRIRKPRRRADPATGEMPDQTQPKPMKPRLPRGFGWLIAAVGYEAAGCGSQLRHLLTTDDEMKALMAATPRMIRLLRPLCHMLGIDPDLHLPLIPGSAATRRTQPLRLWERGPIVGGWLARRLERGEVYRPRKAPPRPPPGMAYAKPT